MLRLNIITTLVNLGGSAYLIYLLYFKGVTKLNFILGNILIAFLLITFVVKIVATFMVKKRSDEKMQFIKEFLKEYENEKDSK